MKHSRWLTPSFLFLLLGLGACGSTPGSVVGVVTVAGAADNSGVTVTLDALSQVTGADGSYKLEKVSVGAHSMSASKEGYATKTQSVVINDGATLTVNFTLDVANHAPLLTSLTAAPPTVARAGKTTLSATATDADGDALTYEWTLPNGWSFDDAAKSKVAAVTIVAPDLPGVSGTVSLKVSDGKGGSVSGTVVISTADPNGPVISAISAVPSVVRKGGTIALAVSASDPNGQALTFTWTAPTGWTLTPSSDGKTATLVAPAMIAVSATIGVTATNTSMLSTSGSVLVATADNLSPLIQSFSVDHNQVLPGGVVHAVVSATDPDGDTLSYTWSSTDATWLVVGTGTSVTVTAPQQAGGSTSLKVTVSDGNGGSVQGTVLLTTSGCPTGKLNCDKNDGNGCEVDSTTTTDCGGCGVACGANQVCDHGTVCRAPSSSCEAILESGKSLGDGIYYIVPRGTMGAVAVYCDMTTDGGGWTGFFAGKNGSPNVFNHFETTVEDCSDPASHCLRRLSSEIGSPEVLAQCGNAKLSFFVPALAYFQLGFQFDWQPIEATLSLGGGANAAFATQLYTGNGGFYKGFIISNNQNPSNTFGSSFDGDAGWNYCNGNFDTTSAFKLFYRNKTTSLGFAPISVNQAPATAFDLTARALDRHAGTNVDYAGTVHFTSSDAGATLPADYTFLPADNGAHNFVNGITLAATSGQVTITITDTKNAALTATVTVNVATTGTAASPALDCLHILKAGASGGDGIYWIDSGDGAHLNWCDMSTDGGGWTAFYVSKNGQANVFNHFEYTQNDCPDPASKCMRRLPAIAAGSETLATCGAAKLGFFMQPAPTNYFTYGSQNYWQPLSSVRAIAGGANVNLANWLWTGAGDPGFIISNQSPDQTFLSGYNSNNAWDYCNGVSDNTSKVALLWRNQPDHFELSADVMNPDPSAAVNLTLRAVNRDGSTNTGYDGKVHFTGSDVGTMLPADYTFVAGDLGQHAFTVTLSATPGTQTITATDTATASLTVTRSLKPGGLGSPSNPGASCIAIFTAGDSSGDGVYYLTDGVTPYTAYCDMTHGGWTVLAAANGFSGYWGNASGNWASSVDLGATPTSLSQITNVDYKATAYSKLTTNEIELCYGDLDHCYDFNHGLGLTMRGFYSGNISYVPYANNVLFYANVGTDSIRTDYIAALGFTMGSINCYWLGINHNQMGGGIGLMGDGNAGCANMGPQGGNFWLDDYALGLGMNSCNDGSCAPTNVGASGITEGASGNNPASPWFVLGK